MSVQTVNMCDIDKCPFVATNQIKNFLYTKWLENGSELVLMKDVDLCGSHDIQYRRNIPAVHIQGDNAHRRQLEDVK